MAGKVTFTTLAVSYVDFRYYPYECIFIMLVWNPIWILFTFIGAIYANYVLFYFIIYSSLLRKIIIVYLGSSITAFNIFIYCNYYAAKIVIENESINRPLFGLLSNHKVGKQTFTNIKLVDCIGWNTAGVHYIDGTLLNMVTLNSVVSYLFTTFILFINFSQNASIIDKHLE
ncbi:hypothetical protein BLOT_016844 [Blomia tropicalis]|nr:hypothetical protein BLOT_016844 [Blomia tropicalis]